MVKGKSKETKIGNYDVKMGNDQDQDPDMINKQFYFYVQTEREAIFITDEFHDRINCWVNLRQDRKKYIVYMICSSSLITIQVLNRLKNLDYNKEFTENQNE